MTSIDLETQYVKVTNSEDAELIEIPANDDGTLSFTTISSQYPGATGLRYCLDDRLRAVRIVNNKFYPPQGARETTDDNPAVAESPKDIDHSPPSKQVKLDLNNPGTFPSVASTSTSSFESIRVDLPPLTESLRCQFEEALENSPLGSREPIGAYWAFLFLSPYFSLLEDKYIKTIDSVSLFVVRNRIDYLELRLMVGDTSIQKLLADFQLNTTDIMKITTTIMEKIQMIAFYSLSFLHLSTMIFQELLKGVQSTQTTGEAMSQSISGKSSVHYLRWKWVFKYEPHSDIRKIKDFLIRKNILEEDFFIEIASLFTAISTVGFHVPIIPNVGIENIKRSLKFYSLNQPTTVSVVESLFCMIPPN